MSEKTKITPKAQPSPDNLPVPQSLWVGDGHHLGGTYPARLVAYYVWVLHADQPDWVAEPKIAYEVASRRDRMNALVFDERPLTEVPPAAFLSMSQPR